MAGAENFERHRNWRTSGIQSSDGCGAVMRIAPLALAFRGEDLLEVDNGPRIRALLDRLIALKAERPDRFFPILGNHNLALLRALGWTGDELDGDWYDRWKERYSNPGFGTPQAYRQ